LGFKEVTSVIGIWRAKIVTKEIGLFLSVEENRRLLLTLQDPMNKWWLYNLGIFTLLVLVTRQVKRGVAAGFGLASLAVLVFSSFFMVANYHIPTEEEKCTAIRELEEMVIESKTIDTDNPIQATMDLRSSLGDFLRVPYETCWF
jgi:hypothetical protein